MPPDGCLLTLRFRPWCCSSAKYTQTICFVTKFPLREKCHFFLFSVLKKTVSSGRILFPELLVPEQSIPLRLKWPMWTFLEWNLFSVHLEMIFPHMQFIVIIFTQENIEKFSKDKLGPKQFDFTTAESFDWPKVTFYQPSIPLRISFAHKWFCFVLEPGKTFSHMERSSLSQSYQSSPQLVLLPWFSSSSWKLARFWHRPLQQPSLDFTLLQMH